MQVDLKLLGIKELQAEMQKLGNAVATGLGRNAVMAGARVAATAARKRAPVETGALRASIRARRDPDRRAGAVRAFAAGIGSMCSTHSR